MTNRNSPELTIGPIFVRSGSQAQLNSLLFRLGISLEMATTTEKFTAPLFRKIRSYAPDDFEFSDIVIPESDLPFSFSYRPTFAVNTPEGIFVPLESFLTGLYREYRVFRSVFAVLTELFDVTVFPDSSRNRFELLVSGAASLGFFVASVVSYGRRLLVDIDWAPPKDIERLSTSASVSSAAIDFRPRPDGTLGRGKWVQPKDCFARVLLDAELRKLVSVNPIDLFTGKGRTQLLQHFEWSSLAKMTSKQARLARIEFIRTNRDLTQDTKKLAEALQKARLYSESSSLYQIAKSLPSLIAEASATTNTASI